MIKVFSLVHIYDLILLCITQTNDAREWLDARVKGNWLGVEGAGHSQRPIKNENLNASAAHVVYLSVFSTSWRKAF